MSDLAHMRTRRDQLFWRLDGRQRRRFELQAAESILAHFESCFPDDTRPRQAIATARAFLENSATEDELGDAHRSAYEASQHARAADENAAYYAACAASTAALFYHPNAAGSDFVPSAANAALNAAYTIAADREPHAPLEQRASAGEEAQFVVLQAQLAALEAFFDPADL